MQIRAEEISQVIREQIKDYDKKVEVSETGTVLSVGDGIARIHGVEKAMAGELLEFADGTLGMVLNLEEDNVGVAVMGEVTGIKEGDTAKRTGRIADVAVGDAVMGRVIDPVGNPLDGKGPIETDERSRIEVVAPGVIARKAVHEPMYTGLKAIDAMTPVGRGQRELIIGDRQIGKTAVLVDAILNQKGLDVKCIYVAVGQKRSTVAQVVDVLQRHGAMDYTTVVSACASDPATLQYIAPYAGCAMGEYYRDKGEHALIIYDDLSKQAAAYRQVSLLLRRPPGREAFPGDIFYNHSRLLERAAKLSDDLGAGSLTALPVIETQAGDVSAFIPTNVISITDGQIYLEPGLFFSGVRPAINVGLSVSRVGGAAQVKAMRQVAGTCAWTWPSTVSWKHSPSSVPTWTKPPSSSSTAASVWSKSSSSPSISPVSMEKQVTILFAGTRGFLDKYEISQLAEYEKQLYEYFEANQQAVWDELEEKKEIDDDLDAKLRSAIEAFEAQFTV
jgi:F-type H+-transporting ATPase subunit alpha